MPKNKIPDFEYITSWPNILASWREFQTGKKSKPDVADFSSNLIHNLSCLRDDLISGRYKHGGYSHFKINDLKPRDIHKAFVRDRVVHHLLYRVLYPYFDSLFVYNSYACRNNKGHHKALKKFSSLASEVSGGYRSPLWTLKCDVKKFFKSVDREILFSLLSKHISCPRTLAVIREVLESFPEGLPLGNLTSQLFGNVYMHEFDRFILRDLKQDYYIRYADDFVLLSPDKNKLAPLISEVENFLRVKLKLKIHTPELKTFYSGVDFLGWIHFPYHRVLRTSTKRRMLANLSSKYNSQSLASYQGLLKHGDARKLTEVVLNLKHGES